MRWLGAAVAARAVFRPSRLSGWATRVSQLPTLIALCFVGFDESSCFIQGRQSGKVIGTGHPGIGASRLYILDTLSSSFFHCAYSSSALSSWSFLWASFILIEK